MSSESTTSSKKSDPAPVLREHEFDGIQEYDQKLPNWWLYTLYITIVWFVAYWFLYYQVGWFQTDQERVTAAIDAIQRRKAKELESLLGNLDDKVLWSWSQNQAILDEGRAIYQRNCIACHAEDLTAVLNGVKLPGESLVDNQWKYGGKPMDLFKLVSKGSPDQTQPIKMVPWETVLSGSDVAKVVAFVLNHHKPPATP